MAEALAPAVVAASRPADREFWTVDSHNWETVNTFLTRPTRLARETVTNVLPMHEIAKLLRNCDLIVKFVDSLYSPTDPGRDTGRLRILVAGEALVIKKFYGHLGKEGIPLLPRSIKELGLAIGNAMDAEAIRGLTPWPMLNELRVSVTPGVRVVDLRPLPILWQRGIFFPSLTDERVIIVEPAITTLVPGNRLTGLFFPQTLLTAAGALHLAQILRGMETLDIDYAIVIEPSGAWQPDEKEKTMLEEILKPKVRVGEIQWTTDNI